MTKKRGPNWICIFCGERPEYGSIVFRPAHDPNEKHVICSDCKEDWINLKSDVFNKANRPERESMHYANGREAKVGDPIVGKDVCNNPIGGFVVGSTPGTDTCNLNVVLSGAPVYTVTAGDCLHADDVNPPTDQAESSE